MSKPTRTHYLHGFAAAAIAAIVLCMPGCATTAPSAPSTSPAVVAEGEQLIGEYAGSGTTDVVFRGIPYAAPPVGARRWRPPAPITPRPGVQRATEFAPACIQSIPDSPNFYRNISRTLGQDPMLIPELKSVSEDCLYLNVWTPNLGGRDRLPVMVWIHGGGNAAGTAAAFQTDGAGLARKGVVVVSFNYRVNVFGFLAHPALTAESEHGSSGNYALLDQIAVLRWVQRNIAAFGGDPGRVTIFGESAGATNVTYLLTSPLAQGLFHRAVVQSGGYAVSDFRSLSEAEAVGKVFAETLPLKDSNDVLSSMRAIPPQEILSAWFAVKRVGTNAPNVDGWVLSTAAAATLEQGRNNHVPLIIGFNKDEWTALRVYWPDVKADAFRQVIRTIYGSLAERALALYPVASDAEAVAASDRWQTDWYFACPSKFTADRLTRAGDKVYFYVFNRAVKAPGGDQLGAYHAAEIPYVWDTLASEPWVTREPWDHELADAMSAAWVRFAATGDPNGGHLPAWPAWVQGEEPYLEFGDAIRVGSGVRREYCEVFEDLQALRMANGP